MMTDYIFNEELATETTLIASVQTRIDNMMRNHGFGNRDRFGVRLCLEEALINAMKHGNNFDVNKIVSLRCVMTPSRVVLEIEDEGDGFNLNDVPDPTAPENLMRSCGRGVHLIRHYMTRVLYSSGGNRVIMEKLRSREAT